MKKIILPLLLALPILFHAQPKLVGTLTTSGSKNGGSIFRYDLPASTPGIIYSFNNLAPHRPTAGVCAGNGNWLYGMLTFNGTSNSGGLYKIQRDGTGFTMLQNLSFPSYTIPYYHTDGNIYFIDGGLIKKLNTLTNAVTNVGGYAEVKNLLIDANNWIYYTSSSTLAKIKTDGTGQVDLHTFNAATEGSGGSGLTEIPGDSLFGIKSYGGINDMGTLYSIKKDGTGFTVHHQFTTATGAYPESRLVYFDRKLYGTTTQGGVYNNGVLYTINPDGSGYRVLHHYDLGTYAGGAIAGNISITSNGRIFGSFYQFYVAGTTQNRLFKVDTSGSEYGTFFLVDQRQNGHFNQDILMTDDETIFFPTSIMGRHDGGVLNQCDTLGIGNGLYHFGLSNNGFQPAGGLIKGSDGKLYGTTKIGGAEGSGIIFSMNQDGTNYTRLHELVDAEGYDPNGKLLEASDGKLYGVCQWGGPMNSGSIYRLNKNGTSFQVIYTFPDVNEYNPSGNLVEDNTGVLYGATFSGGAGNSGVLFKINKDGSNYTVLKSFNSSSDLYFPNGLTVSGNYLYGACTYGGMQGVGGVFRINKNGSGYEALHEFNGPDGSNPSATPVIASNGKLYGTADNGGNNSQGVVYRMDIDGNNFMVLKHFSSTVDGSYPSGGLIQGSDGLLYGTASYSTISPDYGGTVYKMNLDGSSFTLLQSFDVQTEGQGAGSLLDLNGNFIPLPVRWISFAAQKQDEGVLLSWQTATEINSDRFEIERSLSGNTFEKIGAVSASGNTNLVSRYSFKDDRPSQGMNIYRLKQLDRDGTFSYSKLVSVKFDKAERILIAPNPAKDQLIIKLPQRNSFASASILDASGKIILKQNISSTNIQLDIHHLPKGWYVLKLDGKQSERYSFIKQ